MLCMRLVWARSLRNNLVVSLSYKWGPRLPGCYHKIYNNGGKPCQHKFSSSYTGVSCLPPYAVALLLEDKYVHKYLKDEWLSNGFCFHTRRVSPFLGLHTGLAMYSAALNFLAALYLQKAMTTIKILESNSHINLKH